MPARRQIGFQTAGDRGASRRLRSLPQRAQSLDALRNAAAGQSEIRDLDIVGVEENLAAI